MTEYMQVLTAIDTAEDAGRLGCSITGVRLTAYVYIIGADPFLVLAAGEA